MENQIKIGDYVRHKNPIINGNLQMSVEEVSATQVKCSHFVGHHGEMKTEWFNKMDVTFIKEGDGGFVK